MGAPGPVTATNRSAADAGRPPPAARVLEPLLLFDSQALTRECLVEALQGAGVGNVFAVGSVEEAIAPLDGGRRFRAILINLAPGRFDRDALLATIAPLRARLPGCPVLLLSPETGPQHAGIAWNLRVHALLNSNMSLDLAIAAIDFSRLGWILFPDHVLAERPAAAAPGMETTRLAAPRRLTSRQLEVLDQLRTGMSNRAIAGMLNIRERTVKAHLKEIMRRFGVSNRTQIVAALADGRRSRDG